MEYGKYIIVSELGHKVAILFNPLIPHDRFLNCYSKDNIHSAGFFQTILMPLHDTHVITIYTFGKSISLKNISSNKGDNLLIEKILKNY